MAYPGGFRDYLATKRTKNQQQNEEILVSSSTQCIPLFSGLVFYLNGYLSSRFTMLEFKALIVVRGGVVKDYLASNTTHIIATQMTHAKITQLTKPVVKPEWILESIEKNQLLDWTLYRLYRKDPHQKVLSDLFKKVEKSTFGDEVKEISSLDLTNEFIKVSYDF
jgi:hypothetical protein